MAELTPLFMDVSGVYSGDELGRPFRSIMGEGIEEAGDLAVSAGAGQTVNIAAGVAWVKGDTNPDRQPTYLCPNDAVVNKGISVDGANPRKVLVVAQVTDEAFAGTGRKWEVLTIHGTPAAVPAEPALPASAIPLALIDVPAAAASSAAYTITDRRARATVGGGDATLAVPAADLVELWDSVDAGVTFPVATITTPALSQLYRDLIVVATSRTDSSSGSFLRMRVNGLSTAIYDYGMIAGQSAVSSSPANGATSFLLSRSQGTTGGADYRGITKLEIADYVQAVAYKQIVGHGLGEMGYGAGAYASIFGGTARVTAALTTLTFFHDTGNFAAGRITVYGRGRL